MIYEKSYRDVAMLSLRLVIKMKKKNICCMAMLVIMLLSLAACGSRTADTGDYVTHNVNADNENMNASVQTPGTVTGNPVPAGADAPMSDDAQPANDDASGAPVVYFTSDISADGLVKIYEKLDWEPTGNLV